MKILLASITVAAISAPLTQAQPPINKQVPADAKWLVHLDLDAAKAGEVAQTISSLWLRVPAVARNVQQITWATGLDLRRDLHRVLIYGRDYDKQGAVVIFQANMTRSRLLQFLRRRHDYHTSRHDRFDLMRWTEKPGKPDEHVMFACIYEPNVAVFGRNVEEVKHALSVLEGKSPSLESEHPLFASEAPAGTTIQIRGVGFADVKLPFASPLVRKSKCLLAIGGEGDGKTFVNVQVITDSKEIAGQLRAVVDGLVAMARLRFDQNEQLVQLLNEIVVTQNEKTVAVECIWPADKLSTLLKRAWKRQRL